MQRPTGKYLSEHSSGSGWAYHRHLPRDLRPLFGGRTQIVRYITARPHREAEQIAWAYALEDTKRWKALRLLSEIERHQLIAQGGLDGLKQTVAVLEDEIATFKRIFSNALAMDPRKAFPHLANEPANLERMAAHRSDMLTVGEVGARHRGKQLAGVRAILTKVAPEAVEHSLDGLLALWIKARSPSNSRRSATTIALFKKAVGDIDYRTITPDHIATFRDRLTKQKVSWRSQEAHLSKLRAMYAAAVNERKVNSNPARDVRPLGKPPSRNRRPFSGSQLRLILEKAEATKFGGPRRHVETMWLLRLAVWTGARINELAQLRKCDVRTEDGVPIIDICEGHEQQRLKNEASRRRIPMHPAIAAEFVAFAAASKTDFVFGRFPYDQYGGRAAQLIAKFGGFLRDTCGITDRSLTLHSIRHSFHDAMRHAEIPEDQQHTLTGHAGRGAHGKYGVGVGLKKLAASLARVDPLAN